MSGGRKGGWKETQYSVRFNTHMRNSGPSKAILSRLKGRNLPAGVVTKALVKGAAQTWAGSLLRSVQSGQLKALYRKETSQIPVYPGLCMESLWASEDVGMILPSFLPLN